MDVSVIIVSYNTRDLLRECLGSLAQGLGKLNAEVIVIDNGSSDGSVDMVHQQFPDARLVVNATNQGFAAATNTGMRISSGNYILLLNSDTVLLPSSLEKVLHWMRNEKRSGIAGCKLVNPDGSVQLSVRLFPTILRVAKESLFIDTLFPRLSSWRDFDYSAAAKVDWVMGAFFMFDRAVTESIGLLDERFFMFGEELDFCYRAAHAGFPTWYFPGATVIHYWGGSFESSYERVLWTKGSQVLFFQKHYAGLKCYALSILLLIGMFVRVPVYLGEALIRFKLKPLLQAMYFAGAGLMLPFHLMRGTIYPRNAG